LRGAVPAAAVGALTGLMLAVVLVGKSVGAVAPFTLSGLLMASILAWVGQRAGFLKRAI
jgi:hypothetical protein